MPNLNGVKRLTLNTMFIGITSWLERINPWRGNNIELKVGIDFFELGIRIIVLKVVNKDWTNASVYLYERLPHAPQLLTDIINRIIAQNPCYNVSLIANAPVQHCLKKIVTIDKNMSAQEVNRFFKQKVGRLKRFAGVDFTMNYTLVPSDVKSRASHHSYYLVACEQDVVDKLKSNLSSILSQNRQLDVSSLALIRFASSVQLNHDFSQANRWICHITDHDIIVVGESSNGHPYEKVYPLNFPFSSSSDSRLESEFPCSNLAYRQAVSEQVINTLSQTFLRAQFDREFVLLINSSFVWDVPEKAMLMEIPSLSLAQVYFVHLNLTQDTNLSSSNPISPKLALNNEYIVALGLALKGVELSRSNKAKVDQQLTNLSHFIEVNQSISQCKNTLENNSQNRQSPSSKVEYFYD